MKTLITTMASGWYRGLIPLFEYTAKKFNPNCDVKVFTKEELFPNHHYNTTGLLRFCIPMIHLARYDYVYMTDVDFIFLPHETTITDYFRTMLIGMNQDYAGYRGVVKKNIWIGKYARIAGGGIMVTQKWLETTKAMREFYANKYINGIPARASDEICLARIMTKSGYGIPAKAGCFLNGVPYDRAYRNLHLGDFKECFRKRWTRIKRMKRRFFLPKNIEKYKTLLGDNAFVALKKRAVSAAYEIREMFNNVEWYVKHV